MGSNVEASRLASAEPRPIPSHPVPLGYVAPTARGAATHSEEGRGAAFSKQDAAIVWWYCSPLREERKIAAKRFDDLLGRGLEDDLMLMALAEFAASADEGGQPFHAIGFTEHVARAFIATLRERLREESKAEENARPERLVVNRGLRSIADILGAA